MTNKQPTLGWYHPVTGEHILPTRLQDGTANGKPTNHREQWAAGKFLTNIRNLANIFQDILDIIEGESK